MIIDTLMADALLGMIFVPLLAACAVVALPGRGAWVPVGLTLGMFPLMLLAITTGVARDGALVYELGAIAPPVGIRLTADPLSVLMLWTSTLVGVLVGVHALSGFPPHSAAGRRFWPLWLILMASINGAFLSSDLFNLYVTLELITLAAIALIAIEGRPNALRAAMRYLLLAMMASLAYLLGVGLVYGNYGVLDLYQLGELVIADPATTTALALMTIGLLLKSAIFPLHLWLPAAHGNAPGPVSALLSGLVVKVSIYMIYRIWMWPGMALEWDRAATLLGLLGAGAILYGCLAALSQQRLKMVVAYSTVAQLGYLMLLFPLASVEAFRGVSYHILAHGLAKAALFLSAANILHALGTDRIRRLHRLDNRLPMELFTFGLAGISIMGLPPSGGFLAKWMLLNAAWQQGGWGWMAVILAGSLLAAAYIYRVLALAFFHPENAPRHPPRQPVPWPASLAALALAIAAILIGFTSAPILALIDAGLPPGLAGRGGAP